MAFILSRDIFYILVQKHAPPPPPPPRQYKLPDEGPSLETSNSVISFQQFRFVVCIFNNFSLQRHDTEIDLEQVKIERCLIVRNSNTQPDLERTIVSLLIRHCLPGGCCVQPGLKDKLIINSASKISGNVP